MKILVATMTLHHRTLKAVPSKIRSSGLFQGSASEGELVMPLVCYEVLGCSGHNMHQLVLIGIKSQTTTTNFKVKEVPLTEKDIEKAYLGSIRRQGFASKKMWKDPGRSCEMIAKAFAKAMIRAASRFPVGDILSKDGTTFWSRRDPSNNTRIRVILPRNF